MPVAGGNGLRWCMPPKPLLALLGLAVLGHGARLVLGRPDQAAGGVEIVSTRPLGHASAGAHRDSIAAVSRPLAEGERINLDQAAVPDIARLPRVGIALAKRIAADRAARGAFGSLAALDRVPGVGPGLLRALEAHVEFSASGRGTGAQTGPKGISQHLGVQKDTIQGSAVRGSSSLDWLNAANAGQLDSLPGIGRARAAAIVRYREEHGGFAALTELRRVPGINPALLQRLYAHLQVP
jgi:competence ComEA-like helix-hairpin-helix protein